MKSKDIPNIRFPEFNDAWELRKLGELTERVRGNDGRMDLPTLTISAAKGWLDQRERFSANIAGEEQKNYTLLSKGELSYNKGNSKLAKYGVVFELKSYKEALVPRVYHSFRVNKYSLASFIEYMFETKKPDQELAKLISSGARMDGLLNIGYEEFMGIKVKVPSIFEQEKIANLIRNFNNAIALQEQELAILEQSKQGFLQKIFPKEGESVPEVRFPGFTDKWKAYKLKQVAEIIGGGTPKSDVKEYWNGDIDWYSPSEIGKEVYTFGSKRKITSLGLKKSSAKLLPPNRTILFTSRAGIGDMAILKSEGATNQGFQSLVVDNKHDTYFVYSMGFKIKKLALKYSSGSTFLEISGKTLGELKFYLPSKEEQTKIGNFFKQLDETISLHQQELDLLKETKKGFLQKMFI